MDHSNKLKEVTLIYLSTGESLGEVQKRNIAALHSVLQDYENKHIIFV